MPTPTQIVSHDPAYPQARTLRDVRRALRQNVALVLGTTLATIAVAAVLTAVVSPKYQSEALLRLGDRTPGSGMMGEETSDLAGIALLGLGENEIDTDIGVLRSREVLAAVVDSLDLHVSLARPSAPRDSVLRIVAAPRDAPEGSYILARDPDGTYSLRVRRKRRIVAERDGIAIGARVRMGDLVFALHPALAARPPEEVRFRVASFRETVENLRDDLRVSRQTGRSRLVEIRYRGRDPMLTAGVVNGVAADFIEYKTRSSKSESRSAVDVLGEQVSEYARQLREAEDRLEAFRTEVRMVSAEEQAAAQIEHVLEFQAERDALVVERQSLAALLGRIGAGDADARSYRQLATFPSFLTHSGIQNILASLITLENQRADLLVRRTTENRDVLALTERIEDLELQLYELGSSYLRSLDSNITAANAMLARFDTELAQIPEQQVQLVRLTREQEFLTEIYTFLQTRLKEAQIQEAIERGDARIVDSALIAEEPVSPKPLVNLALASVMGLLLGSMIVIAREVSGPRVRTREDAIEAAGGLPLLGVIPAAALRSSNGGRPRLLRRRTGEVSASDEHLLLARGEVSDPGAEAYRSLWAGVSMAARQLDPRPRVLAVTGVGGEEGDPRPAANLAVAFAQQGTRTLLVDVDLRANKRVHLLRDVPTSGFAEVARGTVDLRDALVELDTGNPDHPLLWLPSGAAPRHPAELLPPARVLDLIESLRESFEMVVLHTPPVDAAFEGTLFSAASDATVLVARAEATDRDEIRSAISLLEQRRATILGLVLTDAARPAGLGLSRLPWGA
jgi:succinoglycan biosynthesis transport protein ExoP